MFKFELMMCAAEVHTPFAIWGVSSKFCLARVRCVLQSEREGGGFTLKGGNALGPASAEAATAQHASCHSVCRHPRSVAGSAASTARPPRWRTRSSSTDALAERSSPEAAAAEAHREVDYPCHSCAACPLCTAVSASKLLQRKESPLLVDILT